MPDRRIIPINLLLLLLFCAQLIAPSCRGGGDSASDDVPSQSDISAAGFSQAESQRIKELSEGGGLRALTSVKEGIYFEDENGLISGFHYELLGEFARWMDVDFSAEINPRFSAYFERDGELPAQVTADGIPGYVPNAIENFDLYVVNITILPWRERILTMVPVYPTRIVMMTRSDCDISSVEDLNGKRAITRASTSYERILLELNDRSDLTFDLSYNEGDFVDALLTDQADAAAVDSEVAIVNIRDQRELEISFELSDAQLIGWAFHPEDEVLAGLFRRFTIIAYKSGLLDQLWFREYRITMNDYAQLIGYDLREDLYR